MIIEEKFAVRAPREKVWDFLMDPDQSGPCVPGCEKVEVVDDKTYKVRVKVKIAFVSLTFNMKVAITEMNRPDHLESVATGEESAMASSIKAKNSLDLKSLSETETEIAYRSDVSLFGKLGTMGQSVVKGKAKQLGKQFADALKNRLEIRGAASARRQKRG
jgi:carbon monoxide dehydrogenase subunit G